MRIDYAHIQCGASPIRIEVFHTLSITPSHVRLSGAATIDYDDKKKDNELGAWLGMGLQQPENILSEQDWQMAHFPEADKNRA